MEIDPKKYKGHTQTYVKHFFLQKYLDRVAWNIFSFSSDFVYIDGFSGPWKSRTDNYEDTSFSIAINQLRKVKRGVFDQWGKKVRFRCLFIEKNKGAFAELKRFAGSINDVQIELINGEFEDHVSDVLRFARPSFSLTFIDPTGWTGFGMKAIEPILNLRGEVIINLMFDHINRFLDDPRPETAKTFDSLFGENWYPEWELQQEAGLSREAAVVEVYTKRIKANGDYSFASSTRVMKPTHDRSYFYLIYGTRHAKGVMEFRNVEKKAVDVQELERNAAKYKVEVERTNQPSMFGDGLLSQPSNGTSMRFEHEKEARVRQARARLTSFLTKQPAGFYQKDLIGHVLEVPLVWESDLKAMIVEMHKKGVLEIVGIGPRQSVPNKNNLLRLKTPVGT